MAHTPGPWSVGVYDATDNFRSIKQHSCVCDPVTMALIATCGPAEDEQSQHDADLIAAAPDLLEACEHVARLIAEEMYTDTFGRDINNCLEDELWPAISKAKGEA